MDVWEAPTDTSSSPHSTLPKNHRRAARRSHEGEARQCWQGQGKRSKARGPRISARWQSCHTKPNNQTLGHTRARMSQTFQKKIPHSSWRRTQLLAKREVYQAQRCGPDARARTHTEARQCSTPWGGRPGSKTRNGAPSSPRELETNQKEAKKIPRLRLNSTSDVQAR